MQYPGTSHYDDVNASYDSFGTGYDRGYKRNPIKEQIRLKFVRKVFSIVAVQLLTTAILTFISINSFNFRRYQATHNGLMLLALAAFIVPSLMLAWSDNYSRKVPTNYILLAVLTLGESYLVSFTASQYNPQLVLTALFLTGAVVGALALYAMKTETEINYFGGLIVTTSGSLFFLIIISLFVRIQFIEMAIFLGTCVSAGLYLIYDVKLIMGKEDTKLSLDDYVRGAMFLYVDIIRIFIKILQILQKLQDEKENNERRNKRRNN